VVRVSVKSYLSQSFIRSAASFARQCWKTEREHSSQRYEDDLLTEHQALAIGAISASVSFLEATINELFFDAADPLANSPLIKQLDDNTRRLMACLWGWENYQRTTKVLEKFQHVLRLAGKSPFDKGKSPYQEAADLIEVRNALIHYKPEWIAAYTKGLDQELVHDLERRLRGKFALNPFVPEGQVFFPDRCLCHGCSEWAIKSSINFVGSFLAEMKMSSSLNEIQEKLTTK